MIPFSSLSVSFPLMSSSTWSQRRDKGRQTCSERTDCFTDRWICRKFPPYIFIYTLPLADVPALCENLVKFIHHPPPQNTSPCHWCCTGEGWRQTDRQTEDRQADRQVHGRSDNLTLAWMSIFFLLLLTILYDFWETVDIILNKNIQLESVFLKLNGKKENLLLFLFSWKNIERIQIIR